ncbi:MAG: zinc-ribbon and DUF3426 domain-containing protein [Proteobacteria bacterium]|nr:zinc-ribbon and DUF3426 domain-containing protein [Pseudomonadota bacterium]
MQTCCPQCQTIIPLSTDHPAASGGAFACPSCGNPFDASAHLVRGQSAATGTTQTAAAVTDPNTPAAPADDRQTDLFATRQRPVVPASVPRFARERVRAQAPGQGRWWLASVALLASLLAIIPIADRNELARDPDWRPRVDTICHLVGCTLPPWREPTAFEITAREFNPHPSVKGARMVTLSFRNNAAFAQAWPMLELTASDINGRVIGQRRFRSSEYLGSAPSTPLIQPGQSASATLEIVDPGALSWDIQFR